MVLSVSFNQVAQAQPSPASEVTMIRGRRGDMVFGGLSVKASSVAKLPKADPHGYLIPKLTCREFARDITLSFRPSRFACRLAFVVSLLVELLDQSRILQQIPRECGCNRGMQTCQISNSLEKRPQMRGGEATQSPNFPRPLRC